MNFTFALEQFELFVLILIRLASFVFAAPFFNMANVPRKVKAGFAPVSYTHLTLPTNSRV